MNDAQHPINALPPGYRLGEYELKRVLGAGGFGITYLAHDGNLDKAVAIKEYLRSDIATRTSDNSVSPLSEAQDDDFNWGKDRFCEEARTLAQFDYRHIVKVHRFFKSHNTAYIVMEYVKGETLSAYIEHKGGILTESELKTILFPLLDGLEVVHGKNFLHRDIKPANIIIRAEDNSPVLIDFGTARMEIGDRSRSLKGIVTHGYAPMEQYASCYENQGTWTDIYALGAVCYRALTGERPYAATDRVFDDPLVPVSDRCKGRASQQFLATIDHALQVDADARPQTVSEWRDELGLQTEQEPQPPPLADAVPVLEVEELSTEVLSSKTQVGRRTSHMNDAQHPINALPPGYRLGEYELKRVLGVGGFGITYLAHSGNLKTEVAIKEYLPWDIATRTDGNSVAPLSEAQDEGFNWGKNRFCDEARTLAQFDHRHIIKVYGFFESHNTAYIVMEYVEGETLSAYIEHKGGILTESELKTILFPLLDGLEVVHGKNFLHRDINPDDIIIRAEDNSPVLIDFGAARIAIGDSSRFLTAIIREQYAPIEQYSSRGVQGPWTDIYALGAVCYRALTGERIPDAPGRVSRDPLVPVSARCKGRASQQFLAAINHALQFKASDRPQTVAEWRNELFPPEPLKASDRPQTVAKWLAEAEQGDARAQTNLGLMYRNGEGVPQNYGEAVKWFQKAADQGYARAQNNLGVMYDEGQGVPQDDGEAVKWYQKAAEQGHARAQTNLGLMYDEGQGVPQDDGEAIKWYQKAAEQGDARAQFNLGLMYDEGQGVPQDDGEAIKWYQKAAEQGHARAQFNLGVMYHEGEGVPQDDGEAIKWYQKAAEQGDAHAQNNLGLMYDEGQGVPQDDGEAIKWYQKAAEQGYDVAQTNLGEMYAEGQGVPQDDGEAIKWYQKAAEQGYARAQTNLGEMYAEGQGVPQDDGEAIKWYQKAAEQGYARAQFCLGLMYQGGKGVRRDYIVAHMWYNLAGAQGDEDAINRRNDLNREMTEAQVAEAQRRAAHAWKPK